MKKILNHLNKLLLCISITIQLCIHIYAEETESVKSYSNITLKDIIKKSDSYKNSEVTILLRLKYIDFEFQTISFYDDKNYDIVFDIKDYDKKIKLKNGLRNKLYGAYYIVNFKIKEIGSDQMIFGEIIEFFPFILNIIP